MRSNVRKISSPEHRWIESACDVTDYRGNTLERIENKQPYYTTLKQIVLFGVINIHV